MELSLHWSTLLLTLRETQYAIVKLALRHAMIYVALPATLLTGLYVAVMVTMFSWSFRPLDLLTVDVLFIFAAGAQQLAWYPRRRLFRGVLDVVIVVTTSCLVWFALICMLAVLMQAKFEPTLLQGVSMQDLGRVVALALPYAVVWNCIIGICRAASQSAHPENYVNLSDREYNKLSTDFKDKFNTTLRNMHGR